MATRTQNSLNKRVSLQDKMQHNLGDGKDGDSSDRNGMSLKGKKINVVSVLDNQKSEPCLMKPKKLNLE